jgi:hypothetical protein
MYLLLRRRRRRPPLILGGVLGRVISVRSVRTSRDVPLPSHQEIPPETYYLKK